MAERDGSSPPTDEEPSDTDYSVSEDAVDERVDDNVTQANEGNEGGHDDEVECINDMHTVWRRKR